MKVAVVVVVVALAVAAFGVGLLRGQQRGESTTAASLKIDEDTARLRQDTAQTGRRKATEERVRLEASLRSLQQAVGEVETLAAADAKARAQADAGVVDARSLLGVAAVVDAGTAP